MSESKLRLLARVVALLFVLPACHFYTFWTPWIEFDLPWVRFWVAAAFAIVVGGFVWRQLFRERGPVSTTLLGAVLLGSIGFDIGFFGPLVFYPHANLGPLLGLMRTGPAGFVLGALLGLAYWDDLRDREVLKLLRRGKGPTDPSLPG